jgi:AraC-like DNA-binding protein
MSALATQEMKRFNLHGIEPVDRTKIWSDALNEFYFSYDTDYPRDFLKGEFEGAVAGNLRVATVTADPMHVRREASHVAKDVMDAYFLIISCGSDITLQQRGVETTLREGQFSFVATTEPYSCGQDQTGRFHTLLIPGPLLRVRKPDVDDHLGNDFRASGLQGIFTDFAASFCRHAPDLDVDVLRQTHASLLDMLALVIERTDATPNETVAKSAHRRRILNVIESRFHDPEIGLARIAQVLALSPRYVQQILAANGETVSGLLRHRRIAEACRLLDRRYLSRASIATIAYSIGYNDPAYFSRVFRLSMGLSPLDYTSRNE